MTIAISGHADTDLTLSGAAITNNVLTFTASNWGTAQTVTVKAAEDGDAAQDADVTLAHGIRSAVDSTYDDSGRPDRHGLHHRGRRGWRGYQPD